VTAGGRQGFVLVGEMNGQVGNWDAQVGDNNKAALMAGLVQATVHLSEEAPPDAELGWPDGTTETVSVISAQQALSEMRAAGAGGCPECEPLLPVPGLLTS